MKPSSRNSDERILRAISLRREGVPCAVIAERLGMGRAGVLRDSKKVMDADIAESGEPEDVVRRAYW